MRLTWFGGAAFRLQYGGSVLLVAPGSATMAIDAAELRAGVDRELAFDGEGAPLPFAAEEWRPLARRSPLSENNQSEMRVGLDGGDTLVLEAEGEGSLILCRGKALPDLPGGLVANATLVLTHPEVQPSKGVWPRRVLLAIEAGGEGAWDRLVAGLPGVPLQMLDPGMAVEF
ncbi:hypothetical protein [Cucumibacter marinus]|uniref:hypothetical protein n=1 Tax=Cucumibacter marinus TaxID=1121252 RepID=UPI000407E3F9|nr:hypothetical protein [Cucumibacter marinus]